MGGPPRSPPLMMSNTRRLFLLESPEPALSQMLPLGYPLARSAARCLWTVPVGLCHLFILHLRLLGLTTLTHSAQIMSHYVSHIERPQYSSSSEASPISISQSLQICVLLSPKECPLLLYRQVPWLNTCYSDHSLSVPPYVSCTKNSYSLYALF